MFNPILLDTYFQKVLTQAKLWGEMEEMGELALGLTWHCWCWYGEGEDRAGGELGHSVGVVGGGGGDVVFPIILPTQFKLHWT